jgi:TetR/AcrR family transcriptional regulator, regulator of autoinduction and epiphytic fitness
VGDDAETEHDDAAPTDGRRARRERGRVAVIDAMFSLLQEGKVPPSVEQISERSGVSVASIFRYFQGLDDLQFQTFERFRDRFTPLLASAATRDAPLDARIGQLVSARLDLYEQAGAIMAVGRLRALEHEPLVEASAQMRGILADQVRSLFADELDGTTPATATDLVAAIDSLTSLEAWDVMHRTHARSRAQIERVWRRGIPALVEAWTSETDDRETDRVTIDRRTGGDT